MAHDYTELDNAIIARITESCVGFTALCNGAVLKYAENLAARNPAYLWPTPPWRIVDRRLQALRKAGRIRYQRKPEGWVALS